MKALMTAALCLFTAPHLVQAECRLQAASDRAFSRSHDVVLSPDKKLLHVADLGNYAVKMLASDTLKTVAEIRSELLCSPHVVAIDTVASGVQRNGTDQLNKPEGVDVGGDLVWVADTHNHRVLLFEKVH